MELVRIDKFLSVALGVSRTDAKRIIKDGRIKAEGKTIKRAEEKVNQQALVELDGKPICYKKYIYILMNKPSGILSAATDKRVKTVVDIIPEHLKREGLFPVGRLDKTTTGLLIITNDGDFAHKVISPKSNIEKCYYTELDGELTEQKKQKIENGIVLADGTKCRPAKIEQVSKTQVYITISEGKYHQIKRMFGVVGLGVNSLHRVSIGGLKLPDDLEMGKCIEIGKNELNLINC